MVSIPFDSIPSVTPTETAPLTTQQPVTDDDQAESFEAHLQSAGEEQSAAPVEDQSTSSPESNDTSNSSNETNEANNEENSETTDQEPETSEPNAETETEETPVVVQSEELLIEVAVTRETAEGEGEATEVVEIEQAESRAPRVEAELVEAATDTESKQVEQTNTAGESDTQLADVDVKKDSTSDKPVTVDNVNKSQTNSTTTAAAEQVEEASIAATADADKETPQRRETQQQNQVTQPLQEATITTGSDTSSDESKSRGKKREVQQVQAPEPTSDRPSTSTTNTSDDSSAQVGRSPQNLIARTSSQATSRQTISRADQTRFVNRVARAFEAARNQGGEIRLRLSPPELGSLRLEVRVQSGVMSARVEVDTATARTLLVDNLSVLRERLSEQGVKVERFEVDVPDRQQGQLPDDPRQQDHRNSRSFKSSSETQEVQPDSTGDSVEASDQLNVVV